MKNDPWQERKAQLSEEQLAVTQHDATEKPFANKYWDHKEAGIYLDVVSGEPLFSSLHKYDSGTGWPSFDRPIGDGTLIRKTDRKLWTERTEVRSARADSHLGHVFSDGPPTTGERYCINSAALEFVPLDQLQSRGLGRYLFEFASVKGWELATLAGGCFWGLEDLLKKWPGVIETQVGYTGGATPNATYDIVRTGTSGHAEAVQLLFDPQKTTYEAILLEFFKIHDPTTINQQGNDRGTQYRSQIFAHNPSQKEIATRVIARVNASGAWKKPVVTQLGDFDKFYRAEEDHQDYLEKQPNGYTCHFKRPLSF